MAPNEGSGIKGISPLIAAVLLIATTMTLAGVLAWWASSYVKSNIPALNETQQACKSSDFSIYQCSYTASSSQVTVVLNNIRSMSLGNLNAFVFDASGAPSNAIPLSGTIAPGSFKSYVIDGVPSNFTRIAITSPMCPELSHSDACGRS